METPLGFTSSLLDVLSASRSSLDAFVAHQRTVLESVQASTTAGALSANNELTELEAKLEAITGEDGEIRRKNDAMEESVNAKEKEIEDLAAKVKEYGGEQLDLLKASADEQSALAGAAAAAREQAEASKSQALSLLTKSLVAYRESLSLDFERAAGNRLRLVFTAVSAADPARPHAFTLNVNADERYEVEDCAPRLPAARVQEMLERVNETNDFGHFVRDFRRGFEELKQ
ncbi:hypothetical protein TeGR_g6139 [Tetraparma gracilis]|uniref:Kinetochore protein SPC25 n=1 Tax=Tetraparma gracilis TaxID=2962635 RepID=A0ABQ6M4H3_9STRA|nr:hypothetical protein TeGR_g6139 [Tetraparma gracilis]